MSITNLNVGLSGLTAHFSYPFSDFEFKRLNYEIARKMKTFMMYMLCLLLEFAYIYSCVCVLVCVRMGACMCCLSVCGEMNILGRV